MSRLLDARAARIHAHPVAYHGTFWGLWTLAATFVLAGGTR